MSRSELRQQYMSFQMRVDSHVILPLTLEEALDNWSHNSDSDDVCATKSYQASCRIVAPPPTPVEGFDLSVLDRTLEDTTRGSFSSHESSPDMVEDHSGTSDSDAELPTDDDRYQGPIWKARDNHSLKSQYQLPIIYPPDSIPVHKSATPAVFRNLRVAKTRDTQTKTRSPPTRYPPRGTLTPVDLPPSPSRRSPAQCSSHSAPNVQKSLPPTPSPSPAKRNSQQAMFNNSQPKRSRSTSRPSLHPIARQPLPSRLETSTSFYPRPSTTPSSSSAQPFSFHNTPPLPLVSPGEKSIFEYDSDNECGRRGSGSKWHIRSISLGTGKGKPKSSRLSSWGMKGGAKAAELFKDGGAVESRAGTRHGTRRITSDGLLGIFSRRK